MMKRGNVMKHNYYAEYDNVRLRPLREEDIEKIRVWRNDTENSKYLRKIGHISPEMQKKWFDAYLNNEDELIFAIEETKEFGCLVGSVSLYNFTNEQAEFGRILIGDRRTSGRGIGRISSVLAMHIGFECLGINKIVASVHEKNLRAYSTYMKIGFEVVGKHPFGDGDYELEIEMSKARLKNVNSYVNEINILNGR